MRPQTWSKPKPLVSVAGKTVLGHLLDMFRSIPGLSSTKNGSTGEDQPMPAVEYVLILGPGLGETQIPPYMQQFHPELKTHYVLQPEMKGQSDALWLAREYLSGPLLVCFSDTLIETDFSCLAQEQADGIAWVKPVPDPRRFGVAEVDGDGWVTHLVEKPQSMENNLVVVGCYYMKDAGAILSAIQEHFRRGTSRKGEYYLTDTLNILIERGCRMRTQTVASWLDTGTIEATLETNRYLLAHGKANGMTLKEKHGVKIIPPVFIEPSAEIGDSVIGPYASIGAGCRVRGARIEDSILEPGAAVESAALKGSFLGRRARVTGGSAGNEPVTMNIGDDSSVTLK